MKLVVEGSKRDECTEKIKFKLKQLNFGSNVIQLWMNEMNSCSKKCNYRFCRIFLGFKFLYGNMLYIITLVKLF